MPSPSKKLGGFMSSLSPRTFKSRKDDELEDRLSNLSLNNNSSAISAEDRRALNDPKIRRMAKIAQMYFLENYFETLTYLKARRERYAKIQSDTDTLEEPQKSATLRSYYGRERALLRKRRTRLKYGDFDMITQVGQGGYGQVYLARKRDTREVCALKVLNKRLLLKLDEIQHILTERDILTQASKSEWLVKLLYSFQDTDNLYLAMEFVPGGDFRTLLNNTGTLNSRHTRFYMSEMFMALDALHQLNFIHRDLKPENFLITAEGHIKLTDFGLAAGQIASQHIENLRHRLDRVKDLDVPYMSVKERRGAYRTARNNEIDYANSVVGSPDYMALEVVQGQSYDFTIDYWSMGCMLFEALVGYPPFSGRTTDETYSNLQNWRRALRRPQYENGEYVLSDRTWDLVQRLITSPAQRLRSFDEISNHPYFAELDWNNVRDQKPPFVPDLDGEDDAGYFDDFESEADMAKYKEVMNKRAELDNLADAGNLCSRDFVGFTFKHMKPQGDYVRDEGTFSTII